RRISGSVGAAALGASEFAAALGASETAAALGASETAATGASESATNEFAISAEALHTFTLDSGSSRCFFRDCTTVTPLAAPVPVSLAGPTGGPVVAQASTVLPCSAIPSGSLSGLHLPSFSTNLVINAVLQDVWVDTFIPGGQRVTICTYSPTGRHLATFTRQPGSSLYTLTTGSAQVAASGQVAASSQASASGQFAASCSCWVLSHLTLLWHHRLNHPSLPRLRSMHSRLLVSGLPRSLPPLLRSPAPPCLPCVEGRQRAATSESVCHPSVGGEPALGCEVLEDRQFELECLAAALPRFASMLICPEGDPGALDIPTPRSYAEAIAEVPPPGENIVDGTWIFRVKWLPGFPPAFKARYVARGFSQRQGVDFFHTFSPTPKMTNLWVLLHIAAQCDYELHSLDFSTTFLQGSLHEEIWLRHPLGFTLLFPEGTQWSLRWPVYGLCQAPRLWHDTLRTTLAALGFAPSSADPSLFLCTDTSLPPFYVLVYVTTWFLLLLTLRHSP
ncbi:unnamed protein product, partial [Closterium sp. NIES-53]